MPVHAGDEGESPPWLTIIGIGADGVEGLSPKACAAIRAGRLVVGGARHLALAAALIEGETMAWPSPLAGALPGLLARRGEAVVVLASGDPFFHGIGATLSRHLPAREIMVLPAPSSLSLACARLGWPVAGVAAISLCGRPLEPLRPLLHPGARIVALSADGGTPAAVAALLAREGFGASTLHILENLGGAGERHFQATAGAFPDTAFAPLNLLAIEVAAGPDARVIPLAPGLADAWFDHDGQLTKREVRAVTLAALAPRLGELLWDVGAGAGSIAIEWLLRHPGLAAIGLERDPARAARCRANAASLGVPHLHVVEGAAPAAFAGLPAPDAVFIGGGLTVPGVLDGAYGHLKPGGRIVANSVTLEADAVLAGAVARFGGTLTRIGIERLDPIGRLHGFRPAMTVTQWAAVKP
ncbi:precorrin-6y C5,15-methyltransferase (decarboxylating) subunit CbiE [Zavarzinia compransoris]|uniref:Bifunctional cobalt-precorrin-7 (C(5))-methyltransferase/cobalt-precorrin-6B (C(15))-methyltransferase n=1 Tax=Zavarzinia compransoris TaxID=1264899 RepID=A0A317DY76_9PROT|nr:precorrin-6y C5,15-methyltransferase (decarboxylating) subunit CbiE [Zavarzinia compransoris]PWR19609.1 bifunctional cobalt-precorrin-7 (C(5))-methyltransferase/cobalt-precorrin-6B (C(15))-methyltransferase [Zavarzinia compransoris]TDP40406.1 precorrin-6Y C5,15-methyltransferase (decarboxylating) [Zavarzinia compransoris]